MTGNVWTPPVTRAPIAQYRITATVTGDDVGPDILSWLINDRLHSIAGTALMGRLETITRLTTHDEPDSDQPAPAWTPPPGTCDGPYGPAHAPATADNRCSYCLQPYRLQATAELSEREKDIVQNVLNAVIGKVRTIGASGLHGQILRREVEAAVINVGDSYGVIP